VFVEDLRPGLIWQTIPLQLGRHDWTLVLQKTVFNFGILYISLL